MALDLHSRPNRIPWPPLIGAAALALAFFSQRAYPARLDLGPAGPWLGWALLVAGVSLDLWAMATMARARVNILPHRAAGGLVTSGPFAFTRNPIYLGNAVAFVGIGVVAGSWWYVVAAVVMSKLIEILAIVREERHLALRFGREWLDYSARVPRWTGLSQWARGRKRAH